uniref:Uncharacterized protein n=1 Tax=Megaselia scalaris TaxID=36166 RepID=T1GC74_MEGSC
MHKRADLTISRFEASEITRVVELEFLRDKCFHSQRRTYAYETYKGAIHILYDSLRLSYIEA